MEGGDGRNPVFGGEERRRGEGTVVGVLEVEGPETVGCLPAWRRGLGASSLMADGMFSPGCALMWLFWRRYWEFLLYLTGLLTILHLLLQPNSNSLYTQLVGYVGLAIEAILPLPQIFSNRRARSCKGFRVSVLANWLVGDTMKMSYFFTSAPGKVPWAFKACGIFQACCDAGLGVQWWIYGDGPEVVGERDVRPS